MSIFNIIVKFKIKFFILTVNFSQLNSLSKEAKLLCGFEVRLCLYPLVPINMDMLIY